MPTSWLTVELLSDGQLKAGAVGVGVAVAAEEVADAVTVATVVITASVTTAVTVVVFFSNPLAVTTLKG